MAAALALLLGEPWRRLSSDGNSECQTCTTNTCLIIGFAMHIGGSIGINVGQNLQSLGVYNLGKDGDKPCQSQTWVFGLVLFLVSGVITFAALAFAPASILLPLESVQFVVNIAFNRLVRRREITSAMYLGTFMVVGGIALFVIFGPNPDSCVNEEELRDFWGHADWIVWESISFSVGGICYFVWLKYKKDSQEGSALPNAALLEPVLFTVCFALVAGGQMVVHTKTIALLLSMDATGSSSTLSNWFFWLEFGLVALFGSQWFYRQTQSLMLYDPLLIIPLMQTAFIVVGTIGGGIFFGEFAALSASHYHEFMGSGSYALYGLGLVLSFIGVGVIAAASPKDEILVGKELAPAPAPAIATPATATRGKGQTAASPLLSNR